MIARALAPSFTKVIATDPSPGMVEKARASTSASDYPNIIYRQATSESLPSVGDGEADMVVAGQAAHWFQFPQTWNEISRILRPGGTLAFWGYKDHHFVDYPKASELMNHYSYAEGSDLLGQYWDQPGRSIVRDQYHDLKPPQHQWDDVKRIDYEPSTTGKRTGKGTLMLEKRMTLGQCKSYIRTWSAYHAWTDAHPEAKPRDEGGPGDVVDHMFEEMLKIEPDWLKAQPDWEAMEVDVEWGSGILLARNK